MNTKFIEATDGTEFNHGKFLIGRFTEEEWAVRSAFRDSPLLKNTCGWTVDHILVLDIQTGEGFITLPRGLATADLNEKHQVWVCPMFEPFLTWLYTQDTTNLDMLPSSVNLGNVPTDLRGYRRQRK